MSDKLSDFFPSNSLIFRSKAGYFYHSAKRLDEIAENADQIWIDELQKNAPDQEQISPNIYTERFIIATHDRKCRDVAIYSYAHSMELLLKCFILKYKIQISQKLFETHKLSKFYEEIKVSLNQSSNIPKELLSNPVLDMLSFLQEILHWAGKYPTPKESQLDNAKKILTINVMEADYFCPDIAKVFDKHKIIFSKLFEYLCQIYDADLRKNNPSTCAVTDKG